MSRPLIRRGVGGIESLSLSNSECKVVHPVKSSRPRPFVPDLDFGRVPARLFCSRCRSLIETDLQREAGLFAYFCSFVLILLLLWPCSPIPCYMDSFSDFVHVCPLCSHRIGRYRKFRSSKFYV
ncbi:unnamed protein product [Auanema sp. JU1783]|nr:unnamed protein product [Auanema sp. JU1783]